MKRKMMKIMAVCLAVIFVMSQCAISFAETNPAGAAGEGTPTAGKQVEQDVNEEKLPEKATAVHTITYHNRDGAIIEQLTNKSVTVGEEFTHPSEQDILKYIDNSGYGNYYKFIGWALSTEDRNKATVLTNKIFDDTKNLDFYAVYRISAATTAKLIAEGKNGAAADVGSVDLTQSFLMRMYNMLASSGNNSITYFGDSSNYLLNPLVKTNSDITSEGNLYGISNSVKSFDSANKIFQENDFDFLQSTSVGKVNELPWYKAVYDKAANRWTIYVSLVPRKADATLAATGGSWQYDGESKSATAEVTGPDAKGFEIQYKTENGQWSPTASKVTNVSEGEVKVDVRAVKDGFETLTAEQVTLKITPKPVTVTAEDKTKAFGASEPTLTATESGLLGNDKVTYTLSRELGDAAGIYTITPSGDREQGNYTVSYVSGTLRITSVTPIITPTPTTVLRTATAAPAATVIADEATPLAQIKDEQTPKANLDVSTDKWALINLILAVFTVLLSIVLIVLYFTGDRRREDEYEENREVKRKGIIRIASVVWAIAAAVIFLLTEDMTLQMTAVDKWTWIMGVMALVQALAAVWCKRKYEDDDSRMAEA